MDCLLFSIFACIAEFERELIRSGLAAAPNGKRLGRSRTGQVARLHASGASWREISEQLKIGVGIACRVF